MSKFVWNEETVQNLVNLVGDTSTTVTQEQLKQVAEELGTTSRSVGAKLRKMDYEVEKAAAKASSWTEDQESALVEMLEGNPGAFTYAELAATFLDGQFSAKQLQGKVLSLELTDKVRKAEKKEAPKEYTDAESQRFADLINAGSTIESLAEEFGRTVASIRGKALSLLRNGAIEEMPKQESSSAKEREDVLKDVMDNITNLTVEDLVETTGKSARGIKSMLSRRGISCADYDGAARREKLDAKNSDK